MEHEHCNDVDVTDGAFNHNSVDEFVATHKWFTHVKVCCVFVQSLVSAYHSIQTRQGCSLEHSCVAFLLFTLCVSYCHTGHPQKGNWYVACH